MCEVPIFYATNADQTRRIAQRIAAQIRTHGLNSQAIPIGAAAASAIDWRDVRGAAVGASVHMQKHDSDAVGFARVHCRELTARPSLFCSVSLSPSTDAGAVDAALGAAATFAEQTGWRPLRIATVTGALADSRYRSVVRRFMRRAAMTEHASLHPSRNHDDIDWSLVEQLADHLAYEIRLREKPPTDLPKRLRTAS
jgi:menaquinone-dependent protoporphyrinogen IX oxidase